MNRNTLARGLQRILALWALALLTTAALAADNGNPQVDIVTSKGTMTVELWPDKAPKTVENFLGLVEQDFFAGTIFHRVIPNFMIQGGGYDAGLKHRPALRTVVNESVGGAPNALWTIAMARAPDPDSASSQFFVNVADNDFLNSQDGAPGYTVFGKLTAGTEVAEEIELTPTGSQGGMRNVPLAVVVIETIRRVESASSQAQ